MNFELGERIVWDADPKKKKQNPQKYNKPYQRSNKWTKALAHSERTLVWWLWRQTTMPRVVLGKTKS